jgi:dTDP-4-amino-4,6-dideoxygalactose transaminase
VVVSAHDGARPSDEEHVVNVSSEPSGAVAPLALPSDQDASGRSFGAEELALLEEVIASGTLTATKGPQTPALEAEAAALFGTSHVVPCSSGTAAVHTAIAALDLEPGDEVITTSITDMGALTPILYQGLIPVFADVDPDTGNLTAATIADRLSERTKAIVVTHLFGNPVEMAPVIALAEQHDLPVIEDAAQAFLAQDELDGLIQNVGTIGQLGAFSLQQGKHATTGEGGFVITDDPDLARRARMFVNKAWPYGEANPDHEFLALNYRITELQSAVARAQLAKLPAAVDHRIALARRLREALEPVPGVRTPVVRADTRHVYWRYGLLVDDQVVAGGPDGLAQRLRALDIPSAPRYIQKPAFRCQVIAEQRTFGSSRWPFTLARPEAVDYADERFPGTWAALGRLLVLPFNERFTDGHVDHLAAAIAEAAAAEVPPERAP